MSRTKFWLEWVVANAVGEMLGLGTVFVFGIAFGAGLAGSPAAWFFVVLLACFEGLAVGLAQWLVLRQVLAALTSRAWIGATVAGAVICWLLGMIPSTLAHHAPSSSPPPAPPRWLMFVMASAMGLVLGLLLAVFQWRVLRRHIGRAAIWLRANAVAWAVGMPLIFCFVGLTIVRHETSIGTIAALILGIAAAGAVVGAIHGAYFVGLMWPAGSRV